MKYLTAPATLFLASLVFFGNENVSAQDRNSGGFSQQNQQSGFGQDASVGFGATGQTGQGQQGFSQQQGGLGQSGNLGGSGGQGGSFGQPPVGGQDGFVGSDSDQIRNQQRSQRQNRRALFDFAIDSLNEMRESRRERNASRNRKPSVRVQLRPLFTVTQPSSSELTSRVRSQMERALPASISAQISISGNTATIQGSVQSEYDRQLAAKMLSLQPGISQVENRLTIESVQEAPLLAPAR